MLDSHERTINDFVYVRSELRDILLDGEASGGCEVVVVKNDALHLERCKYLFWIKDGGSFQEMVRLHLRRLQRLHGYLTDFGLDLRTNQGLWMPAIADSEHGDVQINIMVSKDNWVTKNLTPQEIHDDLASSNRAEVRALIDRAAQSHSELRICRKSGKAYRVAVRDAHGNRRTCGLNQYCIALGDRLKVVMADNRYRKKRGDAWRGVEEPLFKYLGKNGSTWFVYPGLEQGILSE